MLSILIPVYNYSLEVLLDSLSKELKILGDRYEIIVLDDCSTNDKLASKNEVYCNKNSIIYLKNEINLGRTVTRKKMAKIASNNYLLFLDSDTQPVKNDFILNFINVLGQYDVICGGVNYKETRPEKNIMLRWKYGHKRESQSFQKRNKKPYLSIISASFVIKKELFLSISESILDNNYGMDVLFAYEMEKRNLNVMHINNPVFHLGLETNLDFITKTGKAMGTIVKLQQAKRIPKDYRPIQEKLLLLVKTQLDGMYIFCFSKIKKLIIKNLDSNNPNLFLFDLYRLYYLCLQNNKYK